MNRRGLLLGTTALLALTGTHADARMHTPYRAHHIVPGGALPLDTFTTPAGAYSFRRLRSAYTGPAIRIRRASDNAETDINYLGFVPSLGAPVDVAAINTHCNATSCFGSAWYDNSGNARHWIQATPANQPALIINCQNSLPCWEYANATAVVLTFGTYTPASAIVSLSVVANRTVGTGACWFIRENGAAGNRLTGGTAGNWSLAGGTSGSVIAAAADATWNTGIGVINGASSSLTIRGTTTTGTATGSVTAGQFGFAGAATTTCRIAEAIDWDGYPLTAPEAVTLDANQRSFWNF